MTTAPKVVLGLDLGTSSAKAVAFDLGGAVLARRMAEVPIAAPAPGYAEQDADGLIAAARKAVTGVLAALGGRAPLAIGVSGATQSLLALDEDGKPLTPALLFADSRAAAQASALRELPGAVALARRTGTPIHAMSPLSKLRWFAEHDPATLERARWWVSAKEYLLGEMTGERVADHSIASTTGLFDLAACDWDPWALDLAHIDRGRLSRLVPTTAVLEGNGGLGLPAGVPIVAGAVDGCLATLGVGAVAPHTGALSIGTSGAIRMLVDRPVADAQARLFCYALTADRWAFGGPISSGGFVLRWAREALFPEVARDHDEPYRHFDELAAAVPAGAEGLLCLPYLLGERAPLWDPQLRGAFVGLTARHTRGHLLRALLEGVAFQIATVLELVDAGAPERIAVLRADGGFTNSPLWLRIMADVLGRPLELPRVTEGACRGAAFLAMGALGLGDPFALAAATPIERVIDPDPASAEQCRQAVARFVTLRDLLCGFS